MAKSWLLDGKTIARNVKTSGLFHSAHDQIKDCGANWECPHCSCIIDNSYVSIEWPGLPRGVKFDPSDVELLEHLAAKCGVGNEKPHPYLDEFIPTLDVEEGICYQHPENLPGARKDGNSVHFFYRTANAYTTGKRKRRKILNASGSTMGVRWHKTGKTKPIFKNVVHHIGYKKIMVLYQTSSDGGACKPSKTNWVMHQYHLGTDEDEKDGEYVVSKIFYQPITGRDMGSRVVGPAIPATPKADARDPPRPVKSIIYKDKGGGFGGIVAGVLAKLIAEDGKPAMLKFSSREVEACLITEKFSGDVGVDQKSVGVKGERDLGSPVQESKCFELKNGANLPTREDAFHNSFFGQDNVDAHCPLSGSTFIKDTSFEAINIENLEVDTPPEFDLAELYFSSQDSVFGGLDCLFKDGEIESFYDTCGFSNELTHID